jgi:hypothetical protein
VVLDTRGLAVALERAAEKLDAVEGPHTRHLSLHDAVERFLRDKLATNSKIN